MDKICLKQGTINLMLIYVTDLVINDNSNKKHRQMA